MAFVSEEFHKKNLNKYNINIKTKYIVGNKILERNTDDSINDDITKGIRCEKKYYVNNKLQHTEKTFDSRIEYTFVSKEEEQKEHICPNCGMKGIVRDFIEGCPYCKTYHNIEYINKDLGSKYHYDQILKNNTYRIINAIVDIIISFIISFIFIKITSRTFNSYDVLKIIIYGIILSLVLYYFFYIIDAYIVIGPIKKYKDKQNKKQIDFWNRTKINKVILFNNLNYELRKLYFSNKNIIDYDILDYIEFNDYTKDNKFFIEIVSEIRVVYFENNKIYSKVLKETHTLQKHNKEILKLNAGTNIIKCHNCGASVDITKEKCGYCNTELKYIQEWTLITER